MKKGFTLIELLVVVLIIGILAAIALPMYTKTVEKSRLAEALTNLSVLEKSIQRYRLENPAGVANGEELAEALDIELSSGEWLENPVNGDDQYYKTKNFGYSVSCNGDNCNIQASRIKSGEEHYVIDFFLYNDASQNTKACSSNNHTLGQQICPSLVSQGFEYNDDERCPFSC